MPLVLQLDNQVSQRIRIELDGQEIFIKRRGNKLSFEADENVEIDKETFILGEWIKQTDKFNKGSEE